MRSRLAPFSSLLLLACGGGEPATTHVPEAASAAPSVAPSSEASADAAASAQAEMGEPITWAATSRSPGAKVKETPDEAILYQLCGASDSLLADVAAHNAREPMDGQKGGSDRLNFLLRAAGEPHVWARSWQIVGPELDLHDVATRYSNAFSENSAPMGVRRCGVGRAKQGESESIYVVTVDALADLGPLPTTARVGQWITLEATMLVPATDAHVVLLGPKGPPKKVVATLSGSRLRSTFSVDRAGAWDVQVLATVQTGPRPVLDAVIYAGATPPSHYAATSAPGEQAGQGAIDELDAMVRMINAARASEGLAALSRDPALEALAKKHTDAMVKAKMIGHDVGDGDPAARANAAGYKSHVIGENVASAGSLEAAHRALWASPSHRGNLLLDRFTKVGVSVVHAADGTVWVTELFAG